MYAVGSSPAPVVVARTSKWQCAKGGLASAALPVLPITASASPLFTRWPTDTRFRALWQKYRQFTASGVWPASSSTHTYQPHSHVLLPVDLSTLRAVTTRPEMLLPL